jgi:uncharacterized protein YdgA (DUF945 family)
MVEALAADFHTSVGAGIEARASISRLLCIRSGGRVKRWVILLLVSLALVVLISPGLIGQFAERSVDRNIRKGTVENEAVIVDALAFDRGWFVTEGRHRIEIKDSPLANRLRALASLPPGYPLPVITVTTRIDHGVIPVASMNRDHGSLMPGLGDAVSTLSLDMPDGETIELPGAVNTRIGLTGTTRSTYAVPAGELGEDGNGIRWGDGEVRLDVYPASNRVDIRAALRSLALFGGDRPLDLTDFDFEGTFEPGAYGFALGDIAVSVAAINTGDLVHGPVSASGKSRILDDRLDMEFSLDLDVDTPGSGPAETGIELDIRQVDPQAFGRLLQRYRAVSSNVGDPVSALPLLEPELQALLSQGLALDVHQLELALPDGAMKATLSATIDENDAAAGNWSALLLATKANADIRAAEALMDRLVQLNPDAGALIGLGYVTPDGDDFITEIRYAKGILTINGAPMTIPLP